MQNHRKVLIAVSVLALAALPAGAQLVDTRVDTDAGGATVNGLLDTDEYGLGNGYSYTGGGAGFGGPLGNGTLFMNSDNANLYVGFDPGADLNDNVVILLDTRSGGFFDADMNDTADPGRNLSSNLTRDVNDAFPFPADYSIVIGGFGIVVFELNAGDSPSHLGFVQFDGTFTGNDPNLVREIAIPLGSLSLTGGVASDVDFFAGYGSDTNFMSDETIPVQPFTGGGNPGFDNQGNDVNWSMFDRFTTVPEPGTLMLLVLGGGWCIMRRRVR